MPELANAEGWPAAGVPKVRKAACDPYNRVGDRISKYHARPSTHPPRLAALDAVFGPIGEKAGGGCIACARQAVTRGMLST